MFDNLICEYQLPDLCKHKDFQTKSLDRHMETFIITENGRLVKRFGNWFNKTTNEISAFTALYKDVNDVGEYLKKRQKFIDENEWRETERLDLNYHGDVEFYDVTRSYVARFTNGQLEWIKGGLNK